MKAPFMILAAGLLASGGARANFAGQWEGQGRIYDSLGWSENCRKMTLDVSQSSTELVNSGTMKCQSINGGWGLITFEISNGEVFMNGQYIGTITDAELSVSWTEIENGAEVETRIVATRNGDQAHLRFQRSVEQGSYTIEGDYNLVH